MTKQKKRRSASRSASPKKRKTQAALNRGSRRFAADAGLAVLAMTHAATKRELAAVRKAAAHLPDERPPREFTVRIPLDLPPSGAAELGLPGLRVGTYCSGICAPEVAWRPLGWRPLYFSEIEPFPIAVQKHRFPGVPNLGDMEKITRETLEKFQPVDLVCAGTPCQAFSLAGLRKGLADPRGNLTLMLLRLLDLGRPRWLVWENVPGVFSSGAGEDFRSFLSGLVGWDVPIPKGGWRTAGVVNQAPDGGGDGRPRYGVAWRVLDAQHFGVPQRRRRVFVVGYLGDWRPAAAVLFERDCLLRYPPPSREEGEAPAGCVTAGIGKRGAGGVDAARAGHLQLAARGEGVAHCVHTGTGSTGNRGIGPDPLRGGHLQLVGGGASPTLLRSNGKGATGNTQDGSVVIDTRPRAIAGEGDLAPTLMRAGMNHSLADGAVVVTGRRVKHIPKKEISGCLNTASGMSGNGDGNDDRIVLVEREEPYQLVAANQGTTSNRSWIKDEVHQTLLHNDLPNAIVDPRAVRAVSGAAAIHGGKIGRKGGSRGKGSDVGEIDDAAPTLTKGDRHSVAMFNWQAGHSANGIGYYDDDSGGTVIKNQVPAVMQTCVARSGRGAPDATARALTKGQSHGDTAQHVMLERAVRRLTPRECERLQGFPDDWTLVPHGKVKSQEFADDLIAYLLEAYPGQSPETIAQMAADNPRYAAIGNSMAVPVMHWIGWRIDCVRAELHRLEALKCRREFAVASVRRSQSKKAVRRAKRSAALARR